MANRKRALALEVVERDGRWHIRGTVVVKNRKRRVRRSTGVIAAPETLDAANELRRQIETEIRDELVYGIHPSFPLAKAAAKYLTRRRERPMDPRNVAVIQELVDVFGTRMLNTITDAEWSEWIDKRHAGNMATTREHYIRLVIAFLRWCKKRPRIWLTELPEIDRDKAARGQVRARRVGELRPDLIGLLAEHASPHYKGQLAALFSAGPRVSSLLYHCRLSDYVAAPGREQITFHDTKNNDDVTAAMHPWSVDLLAEYLEWRGGLHNREEPLFLTDHRVPYKDTPGRGGQTRYAFRGMVDRAGRALRRKALTHAAALRQQGRNAEARAHWLAACSDLALLAELTPHWFRHRIATVFVANGDLRAGMEQGGWRDVRSIMHYSHDVPDHRRSVVAAMDAPAVPSNETGRVVTRAKVFQKKQ